MCLSLFVSWAGADNQTERESAIKAAFIYNFAKFTSWPVSSLAGSDKFVFCVGESQEFSRIFRIVAAGKKIGALPVEVIDVKAGDPINSCQVLYVPHTEPAIIQKLMKDLSSKPVLSVGDAEDFAGSGGIIGFYLDSGRVRFEICPIHASQNGLSISSELLGLARIRQKC